ncbi:MAG: hypothetical protein LPJ89_11320 [Hymenobacteraceae bacterium]|nr:hypothetical protein [Hymenobacteraceae bacterium]MDX5394656.1 hypothetical protein [Hymenobacteraceae bacterium]MDX5444357.1 hypothetical protein [Hymenobacteraceae bacterium]MDX5510687.1 hypothetical protein [Hymenobacteraceae bacterium]
MFRFSLLLAALLLAFSSVQAQDVVLAQDVNRDTIPSSVGPNRKHYIHFYTGLGVMAGPTDGVNINTFQSRDFQLGYRYKLRLAQWYGLGFEFGYNSQVFNIKQQSGKVLPDTLMHKKEQLTFYNIQGGVYQRFNFGKRGNRLGTYIDLGAYGTWAFDAAHKYKDEIPDGTKFKEVKVKEKDLQYINKLNYGVTARFGRNRFVVYGTYRLSDLIKEDMFAGDPQLPRYSFGLQLNLK